MPLKQGKKGLVNHANHMQCLDLYDQSWVIHHLLYFPRYAEKYQVL